MNNRAIGIFDSGLGGLTAFKVIREIMPNEDVIYFGDTVKAPYGEKSNEEIIQLGKNNVAFLHSAGVKVILVACGTVSSRLRKITRMPNVIGVIDAPCRKAIQMSKNKKIGVLATSATIKTKTFEKHLKNLDNDVSVVSQACPKWAAMIEAGEGNSDNPEFIESLNEYLNPMLNSGVDTILLGCTHYPIIEKYIKDNLPQDINVVDAGKESAIFLKKFLQKNNLFADENRHGVDKIFVSGDKNKFAVQAQKFLEYDISDKIF